MTQMESRIVDFTYVCESVIYVELVVRAALVRVQKERSSIVIIVQQRLASINV